MQTNEPYTTQSDIFIGVCKTWVLNMQLIFIVFFTALSWAMGLGDAPYNVKCLMSVDAALPSLQVNGI